MARIETGRRLQRRRDLAHQRMPGPHIAGHEAAQRVGRDRPRRPAGSRGRRSRHACPSSCCAARTGQRGERLRARLGRQLDAALEHRRVDARLGEHAGRGAHMRRLAVVRGAGERQFVVGQVEPVGRAALDQRQRLQRLDRAAREDRAFDIAERREHARHRHRPPPPTPVCADSTIPPRITSTSTGLPTSPRCLGHRLAATG